MALSSASSAGALDHIGLAADPQQPVLAEWRTESPFSPTNASGTKPSGRNIDDA
ncbi:MAG TPA: hypothetical protein PLS67_02860 [Accumulibacter sp.]|jgi:hypothetical protein|nr:hypothetical protein [Accumulibacter sp.]HQC79449.1 hypothetical protein [Accumulibacter sp.]